MSYDIGECFDVTKIGHSGGTRSPVRTGRAVPDNEAEAT
jgi:hypothetical protein